MIENYPTLNLKFIFTLIASIIFWTISLITDQLAFTYFSAFFGTVISFLYLLKFFKGTLNPFKFLSIASISLIFTINISWIISGIFVSLYYRLDLFLFFENILNIKHESYLGAIIFTLMFSLVLFFFSLNKKLILKEKYIFNKLQSIIEINNKTIYLIITIIIILETLLVFFGFIGYREYEQENFKLGIISPWIPYLGYIFHFHISLLALLLYKNSKIKVNLKNYFLIIVSILLLTLIFFSRGRYQFFFSFIELAFWFCFFNKGLPKLRTTIIVIFIFLPFIYYLTLFNDLLRYSVKSSADLGDKNLLSMIKNTYELWQFSSEQDVTAEKTTANFTHRFLTTYPLAVSFELESSKKKYLLGENILNNLLWAVPRIIFPQKVNYPIGETLIYKKFGIDFGDTANSLYLFSYLDFWYFGIFLYPLFFFFYWRLLLFLITLRDFNPLILAFILSPALIIFFTAAEGSVLGYLSYARNSSILLLVLAIFTKKNLHESNGSSLK